MMASRASATKRYEKRRYEVKAELRERQEADNSALTLVMELLENDITELKLISAVSHLSVEYYKDVTEERALSLSCGYPLCNKKLKSINHKQKYHISSRVNKVYDVSERKYFCSQLCYKASKYLESQISSEPLWSRGDSTRSDIKLLSISPTSQPGGDKPEKCDDVTTLKDNSVLIDSSTVYKDLTADDPQEWIIADILKKLEVTEKQTAGLALATENILCEDELSDDSSGSSDEEKAPAAYIDSLLTQRRKQRLNITSDLETKTKIQAAGDKLDHVKSESTTATNQWTGSMLNRAKAKPSITQSRAVILDPSESLSLASKQKGSIKKIQASKVSSDSHKKPAKLVVRSRDSRSTVSHSQPHRHDLAIEEGAGTRRVITLDQALPVTQSISSTHGANNTLQCCMERLDYWFTDETRTVLFLQSSQSEPSADNSDHRIPATEEDNTAGPSTSQGDEVEVTTPNVESVSTQQHNIVYHRILKSFEKVGFIVQSSQEFRDKLSALVKTFKLNRENITAKPLEWNIITLILINCLYRDDDDLSKVIMELIQKMMKTDQDTTSQEIITNFILYHHKQATSGISDK